MKRLLLSALLGCLLIPQLAHAQRRGRRPPPIAMGLTFGVKAGVGLSNLTGYTKNAAITYDTKIGPVAGGLVNYRFTPEMSVQLEGLYAPRGTKRTTVFPNGRREEKLSLNYLDIPLLFKVNLKIFYLEAGGVPSLLLSSNLDKEVSAAGQTTSESSTVEGINSLDVGYCAGLGVEVIQGGFFGVRYVRSSSTIGQGGNIVGADNIENTSIQVTGGYIFGHQGGRRRR